VCFSLPRRIEKSSLIDWKGRAPGRRARPNLSDRLERAPKVV
jgi:hypothetical protein